MFDKHVFLNMLNTIGEATMETGYKNGVEVEAYTFRLMNHQDNELHARLYIENLAEMFEEMEHDYSRLLQQVRYMLLTYPSCDATDVASLLGDWNLVKDKLILCVQRKSEEALVKRNLLDLDVYVRVLIDENASCKVTANHVHVWGKTEEEVFAKAKENTINLHEECDFFKTSMELMGMPSELLEMLPIPDDAPVLLRYKNKPYGAGCLYLTEVLNAICERYDATELLIIPSSVHEIIVHKKDENIDWDEATELVCSTNESSVAWDERLSDHVYGFKKKKNQSFLFIP